MNKVTTCCKATYTTQSGYYKAGNITMGGKEEYMCDTCNFICTLEDTPVIDKILEDLDTQALAQSKIVEIPNSIINDIYFLKHTEYSRLYDVLYNNEDASKAFLEYIKLIKQ